MSEANGAVSLVRLIKVLLPIALVLLAVKYSLPSVFEKPAQERLEANMLERLLADTMQSPTEKVDFVDADGDLLCDPPAEGATPEKLVFSYIAASEETDERETWADLMEALSEATGLPVEYAHYETVNEQLDAIARGEVHVAGLNTGAVPLATRLVGFHPVVTLGSEDGSYGYTMKLLAPSGSGIKSPADLRGHKIAFTRPDSNSGFKAAVVYLLGEHDLQPERDYQWGFTLGHDTSIHGLAEGVHEAAPVASDILQRMSNDGEVDADAFGVVYESERFPPASIGYAHSLSEDLRSRIADALASFEWAGTSVEAKYGSSGTSRFVPVNYKDDWANIRRIDEAISKAKSQN